MKFKFVLRIILAIVFGFIGALIAKLVARPDEGYFWFLAITSFSILGLVLPEFLELAARSGIAVLARQIASHLPNPLDLANVPRLSFPVRRRQIKSSKYLNAIVVDTSVLVDLRILDIVKTGFIYGTFLVIPEVVGELHKLADSSDELRRGRGRRGLETLSALQKEKSIKVEVLRGDSLEGEVDDKLVKLAKKWQAKLLTLDFNLNKVAKVHKVAVLNINELAKSVKTAVLPNDRLKIQVISQGQRLNQGVGYLSDGTMVVVEAGAGLKGQEVEVVVKKVLETVAGKMVFAKPS